MRARPPFHRIPVASDARGAAIIEFAIVAPVLVLALCGMADIALTIYSRLQATNTAQSAADLATQNSQLRTSDLADVYNASYDIMRPLPTTKMTLRITNIYSDGNGQAWVYWSCGQGSLAPFPAKSNYMTTPTGSPVSNLLWLYTSSAGGYNYYGQNTSFVMVEANYVFSPPTGFVLNTDQVTYVVAYSLPRVSTYIGFPWDGVAGHAATLPASTTTTKSVTMTAGGNSITCQYAS